MPEKLARGRAAPNDPLAHTEPSDVERSLNLLLSRLVSMQMEAPLANRSKP
jgi:hypothetical protein